MVNDELMKDNRYRGEREMERRIKRTEVAGKS